MSLQFCYTNADGTGTPHIEREAFHLLTLYDERVDTTVWDATEVENVQNVVALQSKVGALEARMAKLRSFIFRVQRASMT